MKKFGIYGTGMIAHFHALAIQHMNDGQLTAVYGRDVSKATAFGEKYGCKFYHDPEIFFSDVDIDIVTIATPSGAHLDPTIKAANAGKHVICEKPLEITPDRIQQMIDACAKANVVLSGIFNRRFNPAVEALKSSLDAGRFGQLTLCDAQIKWYRTQEYYDSGQWRGTKTLDGGGALMNQSIHTIDQLLYFAGPVKRVCATVNTLTHQNIEVEDNAVAILEFENGALGTIQASTSCWSKNGHPAEIQICGEHGSAFLRDDKFSVWEFKNEEAKDEKIHQNLMAEDAVGLGANDPNAINFEGHQKNFEDVVEAIEQEREPLINGVEAMKSVALINAIYKSAEIGSWVKV